jgi:hypothetical protein
MPRQTDLICTPQRRAAMIPKAMQNCQAEQPHVPLSKCLQFSWTAANMVILAKDDPAPLTSKRQPSRIIGLLGCLRTIDISQRLDYQTDLTERSRKRDLA